MIDSPEANEHAQEIAARAVTLVRNNGSLLPLAAPEQACYVVMPESRYSVEGQQFQQEIRKRAARAAVTALDASMTRETMDQALEPRIAACPAFVIAAIRLPVTNGRGSVGLAGELPHAVESLIATGKPVAMVALGNPYLLRNFGGVAAYLATFSTVPPSETAAVQALWGEISVGGHLPVTIPGFAAKGDGIAFKATRPAAAKAAGQ